MKLSALFLSVCVALTACANTKVGSEPDALPTIEPNQMPRAAAVPSAPNPTTSGGRKPSKEMVEHFDKDPGSAALILESAGIEAEPFLKKFKKASPEEKLKLMEGVTQKLP